MNRLPALAEPPHLDLVHVARRIHKPRGSASTLLATSNPRCSGSSAIADIPGGEVCSRYAHFLRTGDDVALVAVVDHNEWDVVAMAALVGLYGEPLEGSRDRIDWAGVARTVRRAGSLELAGRDRRSRAVERGGGREAVRARGEIAKARGDKARALADFASLVDEVDDPVAAPRARQALRAPRQGPARRARARRARHGREPGGRRAAPSGSRKSATAKKPRG